MELNNLGSRIEYAMGLAKKDRYELSELLGIYYETLGRYIRDNKLPKGYLKQREVADALGVTLDWLRTGTGPMRGGEIPPTYLRQEETPTEKTSNPSLVIQGLTSYSNPSRIITPNEETDVVYEPMWVVKILLSAAAAVLAKEDVERARRARRLGKPFRFRLVYEEETDPREREEPSP